MTYKQTLKSLAQTPKRWLITGVAGFIGSHLLETLLNAGQHAIGLDNFATGHLRNLDEVHNNVGEETWQNFRFMKADICNLAACQEVCKKVDIVLHQAALGSVPRSIENPLATNESNINGFLNMLIAAKNQSVKRFVYAASSSTYGDHPALPKVEDKIGRPLSPYAVTKYVNELYAEVFSKTYGIETIGLRYFNVFGPRQDPNGAYAAVIPKWFSALIKDETVYINGDGETSRDFCYIDNCVQANILAATVNNPEAVNSVYNVAFGQQTTLFRLFELIRERVSEQYPRVLEKEPVFRDFRPGDVRHSLSDISRARERIGDRPNYDVRAGIIKSASWYFKRG